MLLLSETTKARRMSGLDVTASDHGWWSSNGHGNPLLSVYGWARTCVGPDSTEPGPTSTVASLHNRQEGVAATYHDVMESVAAQRLSVARDADVEGDHLVDGRGDGRRRRNRALAAQRRTTAIRLITQGQTYQQVADALGYQNRGTVHHIVRGALAKEEAASVQEMRARQGARLDALLSAVWEKAMAGDPQANNTARQIVLAQCRLLGLIDAKVAKKLDKQLTVVLSDEDLKVMGFEPLPS